MPKIRGIKPELWTDEDFVELSPYARLLWIGLWNFACDNGHIQDKPKQIKMRILPTDDVNCAELLREISSQGLIERADGWVTIPNLSHHQKPHKRWFVVCEKPGCEFPEGFTHGYSKRESTVEQPEPAPSEGSTTVAQPLRNRTDVDVDGDGDSRNTVGRPAADPALIPLAAATAAAVTKAAEDFDAFWAAYPRKVGKPKARSAWIKATKTNSPADILDGAKRYRDDPNRSDAFTAHPTTWLNRAGWNDEPLPARMTAGRSSERSAVFDRQMQRAIERERQMGLQ